MVHWVDKLANDLIEWWGDELKEPIILNGGLSVSGLQHVGRLRGEITLNSALLRVLEEKGYRAIQYLTLYTQDEWKGKEAQLSIFRDREEAKRYIGWRLIDVPDPFDCHANWVEHFWEDFGGYLDKFAEDVKVVTTTELYEGKLKEYVKKAVQVKEDVRRIINKYRGRKPFPEGWIPFQARCPNCGKIGKGEILDVDLENYVVRYKCNSCGYEGTVSMENGKLNWRIEWAAIWSALSVSFEPYGKDHATPGGSRDSAAELSIEIFDRKPPYGTPYEWVGEISKSGERSVMGSSDFSGFTPREWYEVAEPEIIRYIYLYNEPMKQIFLGLHLIPQYYNMFDEAEEIYFNKDAGANLSEDQIEHIKRSYELAILHGIPERKPVRVPFDHLALVVQTVREENLVENSIKRLKSTLLRNVELEDFDIKLLGERIIRAKRWVELYAPETLKFKLITDDEAMKIREQITSTLGEYINYLEELHDRFSKLAVWESEAIKEEMKRVTSKIGSKKAVKRFFAALYMMFLGKQYGPRVAPMLASLNKDFVLKRMRIVMGE